MGQPLPSLRLRVALPVVIALLAHAAQATAEEQTSWSLTETLIFEWHGESDSHRSVRAEAAHDRDNYLTLKNRANLGLRRGPLDFSFRFDQSAFFPLCDPMPSSQTYDPDAPNGGRPRIADVQGCRSPREGVQQNDFRIERASARLRLGRHRLYFGDFPLQIGRGIALSLRRVSEFGIDDALRGARAQLRLSDDVKLDLFGGQINIANLDEVTDTYQDDPRDRIVGMSIEGRILNAATVSAHGVMLFPQSADASLRTDLNGGEWTSVVGATVEVPGLWDALSFFIEADGLMRSIPGLDGEDARGSEVDLGFALYSAVDLQVGRFTLLGELKYYDNFEVVGTVYQQLDDVPSSWRDRVPRTYSQPPTIEREDQPILNNRDVLGGRLRLNVRLPAGFLVYGNVAFVGGRAPDAANTLHSHAGLEYRLLDGRINGTLSGGYRRKFGYRRPFGAGDDIPPPDADELQAEIFHGEANLGVRIHGRHSLHLALLHETWNKPDQAEGNAHYFHRGTVTLGYDFGSTLSVSAAYEYDTQFSLNTYVVNDETVEIPGRYEVGTSVRQHFVFGEVRYAPLRWLDLRLRGGTQRGGLRCISGMCRQFPNFTGVRLETIFRY